jgi:hypothetical protein
MMVLYIYIYMVTSRRQPVNLGAAPHHMISVELTQVVVILRTAGSLYIYIETAAGYKVKCGNGNGRY